MPAAATGRLRRWPRRTVLRSVSVAAIASGVAVFVVSSVVAPVAGADSASGADRAGGASRHARHHPTSSTTRRSTPDPAPRTSKTATNADTAPASSTSLLTKRDTSTGTQPASVDHTVISGLAANGIPSVALNAYRVAAARVDNDDPACGIQWSLLAGIGREESDHGQFGGAVLHADGLSTPEIIGPALDGKNHNQYIPAPANGVALDGDAEYAHALGPMQFIPTTWAVYGTDADGDGQANIFDINDAALATARYLCTAGGDLTTRAGRVRAVFAYNHTDVYVAQVLALAHAYKTGTTVTGLPQGNTTGKLPGLGRAGTPPAGRRHPTKHKTPKTPGTPGTRKTTQPPLHLGGGSTTSPTPHPTHSTEPTKPTKPTKTPPPTKTHSPTPSPSKT
ncbi:lytic transglycosylase domain-containing protein, partial [Jatrophihabitans endophyticus]|uniref:lytic transglycosylase domain-containing protein n=1 Tax=Jatrophihabitans endophyticus TaxID=1206085 RepID=UPI0019FE7D03